MMMMMVVVVMMMSVYGEAWDAESEDVEMMRGGRRKLRQGRGEDGLGTGKDYGRGYGLCNG